MYPDEKRWHVGCLGLTALAVGTAAVVGGPGLAVLFLLAGFMAWQGGTATGDHDDDDDSDGGPPEFGTGW